VKFDPEINYRRRGELCTGFWWGNLRERDHWGDPDVDEGIILRWIFQDVGGSCGDWMDLAHDREGGGRLWVR
jgi:hypothetical protein